MTPPPHSTTNKQSSALCTTLLIFFFLIPMMGISQESPAKLSIHHYPGKIKQLPCAPDCNQYVFAGINTSDTIYLYPTNLPDDFQINQLEVVITGAVSDSSTTLYKPGPDGSPIPYIKLKNLVINDISKKETQAVID